MRIRPKGIFICRLCLNPFERDIELNGKYYCSNECRFWDSVDKSGDCWIWKKYCFNTGYGCFRIHPNTVYAHRFAWHITYGSIPDGNFVCHHCDNPPCVNPLHLFLGEHIDNMKDMTIKGRGGTLKATPTQVFQIRNLVKAGVRYRDIIKHDELSNLSKNCIIQIGQGKTHKHLL
jgi:hypothetical protein